MKIAILGATGRVGSVILENALRDNHKVNALVRNSSDIDQISPLLSVFKGDVLDESLLEKCFLGCDVVISALGTDKSDVLSRSMPAILKAMRKTKVERIISIGTAGILQASETPSLYRFQTNESRRKRSTAAEDHLRTYFILRGSGMKWTIVCPTYLPEGKRTGVYRIGKDKLPVEGKSISIYDTADYTYSLISDEESFFSRMGICY